jgi:hypothetical protein
MERDKKNEDTTSDRNNKCVCYCSKDRRLIFIAPETKELKMRLISLNPLSSDLFLVEFLREVGAKLLV